jgi:phenylacetate-coenzyme A ligase PaaK-like adenylate-forming protein
MALKDGEKDKILVRLEPKKDVDPSCWGDIGKKVSEELRGSFMINMNVEIVPPGTLPVFDLKAKRFRDLRKGMNL